MAQAKEQSQTMAQAQNRNTESTGEKRPRTRRPYYQRRPRRPQPLRSAAGLAVDEGKGRRGRRPLRRVGDGPCAT